MRFLFYFFLVFIFSSCQNGKEPLLGETEYQRNKNASFKDATKSPLSKADRKKFKGLSFFPFDSSFVVQAQLKRIPNSEWFQMNTTTDRSTKERVFGVLSFRLQGKQYSLNVYQGEENLISEDLKDYLFLPFLDLTNGNESYGGGRYIDLKIPESNNMIIDFNKAYNPYCVYNEKFSCPIVPRDNFLNTEIRAGEMNYEK
ncbi:MAG: DUF1684 domain-containing protein [bacterium]